MNSIRKMKATILGSGTCVPSLERYPCSVLLQVESTNFLLDIGPGIMGQLLKCGVHINDIDIIFLSHFHLDHCADLAPFIFATKYPGFERTKKLTLIGGGGINSLFSKLNDAYNGNLTMPDSLLQIMELPDTGQCDLCHGKVTMSWATAAHKPESRSYRFKDSTGYSIVYSGDTDFCQPLVELAKDADIMICESAYPDGQKVPGHLTPSVAGDMAASARVKKLVLTHFYPECDQADIEAECRTVFDGRIVIAHDLMVVSEMS